MKDFVEDKEKKTEEYERTWGGMGGMKITIWNRISVVKILARNDTVTDNYGTVDLPAHNAVENVQTEAVVNYSVPVANHCTITCE